MTAAAMQAAVTSSTVQRRRHSTWRIGAGPERWPASSAAAPWVE